MQELFASIDPHKKGYITFNDWNTTFKKYQKIDELHIEEL
jgi:hypothetical protein